MKQFVTGMVLGAVTGAAMDMVLHTNTVRRTPAGKTMKVMTNAVDSAAATVRNAMDK